MTVLEPSAGARKKTTSSMNGSPPEKGKHDIRAIIKYAGAFIAWVVGSGFATGQEILRFYSSYGYASYCVVLFNLVGFLFIGQTMLVKGYEHRGEEKFNHFLFYCGNKLGTVYSWLVPATLLLLMSALISGSGATLSEYYGINHYIGSAIMAAMVLCAYLVGFEKLVKILSTVGPAIIIFVFVVGLITVIADFPNIKQTGRYEKELASLQPAPVWVISAALYIPLNFLCSSTYYTALGKSAKNKKDAKWGAIAGAFVVILVVTIMNTAILLNAGDVASLSVPTLYLAKKISYALGAVFSIVLILGIFSSCSTMMWSFCNKFFTEGTRKNRLFAVVTSVVTFVIGLFPFRELVGVFYPFIGYLGLIFIACVIYKGSSG